VNLEDGAEKAESCHTSFVLCIIEIFWEIHAVLNVISGVYHLLTSVESAVNI
jgi:hypothetical protein